MYIDEKLIKILEPHRGETIDVSYAISLIKTIAEEHENEQCDIPVVVKSFTAKQVADMLVKDFATIEEAIHYFDNLK
ncbi:MAG: hypothetical protein HKN40_12655 [Winogradskyella sp.]|uniref:hypothetical protein n=1 Tax=Winogradskyella sp. TaxID=1883156 RepID=UPI0017D970C0|nr:hypothetical protein [Winogradskyella sp.]